MTWTGSTAMQKVQKFMHTTEAVEMAASPGGSIWVERIRIAYIEGRDWPSILCKFNTTLARHAEVVVRIWCRVWPISGKEL